MIGSAATGANPSSAARRKPRNHDGYGVFSYLDVEKCSGWTLFRHRFIYIKKWWSLIFSANLRFYNIYMLIASALVEVFLFFLSAGE